MARIERTNEKYSRAAVKRVRRLANLPPDPDAPEDPDELMKWLHDEPPYDKKPTRKRRDR